MKRKFRGVVVGIPYYAKFLAALVNEHSERWRLKAFTEKRWQTIRALLAMRGADALISFGGPGPNAALAATAKRYRVPVFVIWAGSDVIAANADPSDLHIVKQEGFTHLSDGPWLVDELAMLGLRAEYQPITAVRPGRPLKPLPKTFRVLTYLPEPRREFYGAKLTFEVARNMPDVEFVVCGAGGPSPDAPPNVTFLGHVQDVERHIDESTVLLRMPNHDGKSMFVLETLSRGRHVVWNYEFPHVRTARDAAQVLSQLQELKRLHASGELSLNEAGRAFVLQHFSREETARRLEARLNSALQARSAEKPQKRRVAISGLPLFCGQVAACTKELVPQWDPHLLRTGSRLEVLTAIWTLASCDVWYSIGSPVTDRWLYLAARLLRKPHVVHWVGSDITSLSVPRLRKAVSGHEVFHLAEISWTAEQLREYGLLAQIAPLPPRYRRSQCVPLPEKFTLLLYVPRTRMDFYGRRTFERLMKRLAGRDVRYLIVGGGELSVPQGSDVQNLGWRDTLDDVYAQTTALIRYTERDGLSLMVLEALSFGRHVLWTQPFPFVRRITTDADIEREVLVMLEAHHSGLLQPQQEASLLIDTRYGSAECTRAIVNAWHEAVAVHSRNRFATEAT